MAIDGALVAPVLERTADILQRLLAAIAASLPPETTVARPPATVDRQALEDAVQRLDRLLSQDAVEAIDLFVASQPLLAAAYGERTGDNWPLAERLPLRGRPRRVARRPGGDVKGAVTSRYRILDAAAFAVAWILVTSADVAAQRVRDEVVELSNGDRVTGEIKGLDRSQLTVRTLDLGTVYIRWQRVVRLNSNRTLEIELAAGRRLQGSFSSPVPGALEIRGGAGTATVDLASIVVIRPVAQSLIGDLTGRIDAGFSYTRSSQVAQSSINTEITKRRPAFESTVAFNAVLTMVEGQRDSSRYLLRTTTITSGPGAYSPEDWSMPSATRTWAFPFAHRSAPDPVIEF